MQTKKAFMYEGGELETKYSEETKKKTFNESFYIVKNERE